jgi:hypothetical protein
MILYYYYYLSLVLDFFKQIILKIFIVIIHVLNTIFIHNTSMYIHITYINAHIHQGLNLKLHGLAPRSSPPNHFKTLIR